MRSRTVLNSGEICSTVTAILGISVLSLLGGTAALAQAPTSAPPAQHAMTDPASQNKQLADQVAGLQAQVTKLQAAIQQAGLGKKMSPAPDKGMVMMDDKSEMAMPPAKGVMTSGSAAKASSKSGMNMSPAPKKGMAMMDDKSEMAMSPGKVKKSSPAAMGMQNAGGEDDKGEMSGMSTGGNGSMPSAPAPAMGMCCMGEIGGMSGGASGEMSARATPPGGGMATMSAPSSAMPGQPGASHLYHVGSTGFFLNHSQHIMLTADQKYALNRLKERAMLDKASEQRKIDQAEQELYTLTGADPIDSSKVQAKIGEIEKVRADQRMNFIRAVGEAGNVLTHDQHQALMGTMAASKK